MRPNRARWIFSSIAIILSLLLPASAPVQGATQLQRPLNPTVSGPEQSPPTIDSPVVARVYYTSRAELEKLAGKLDIWEAHPDHGYVLALLSPENFATLISAGQHLEIDFSRTMLLKQVNSALPGQTSGIPGFPCYRTVEETYSAMAQLAADHPNLASWNKIGESWDKVHPGGATGYDLQVLVITNKKKAVPKPKFFLMAEIHAREYVTAETAARLAEYLVNNYGVDPDVTWLLDYHEIHILTMTNPDGRKFAETGQLWRKNTDNVNGCTIFPNYGTDLNRNSSFMWGGAGSSGSSCDEVYRGASAASEPETKAVQDYVASILPDLRGPADTDAAPDNYPGLFVTLHSYSDLVLFPWGWTSTPAPNQAGLQTMGRKFGYYNHYTVEQSVGLYPTSGSTDDWAYNLLGVPAYTFEMGTNFFQDCTYFTNTILPDNFKALLFGAKATRMPYRLSRGPEVTNLAAGPAAVKAGDSFTLTGWGDDTRYSAGEPTQNIAAARYSVDKPSWDEGVLTYPMLPKDGAWNSKTEELTASIVTTGWSAGKHLVFVEAQDASGNWGVPSAVYVYIATFVLTLTPPTDAQEMARGATATYILSVANTGSVVDTYDVQVENSLAWMVTAPASIGPVLPGAYQDFIVQAAVPVDVTALTPDVTTITLTSTEDHALSSASTLSTSPRLYGFTLTPATADQTSTPGKTVVYHLTVTGTGALADSYTVTAGSSLGWALDFPATLGPLDPGNAEDLAVSITISGNTIGSTADVTTVNVSSVNNPLKTSSAILTTKMMPYQVFIPAVNN